MKLLLDTHVVLWSLGDPAQLRPQVRARVVDPANIVAVSAASAWEIAIKIAAGKLEFEGDFAEAVVAGNFLQLPITIDHSLAAGTLPPHHRDPFDRMLVAPIADGWTLVTRDRRLSTYGVPAIAA